MTNTYAINCTRGQEFRVREELMAIGLHPWVPVRLDSRFVKEKGEKGEFVWYDVPYIPKLIFSVIPSIYWTDVRKLKHVVGRPMELSRLDVEGYKDGRGRERHGLRGFRNAVEAEYADKQRHKANSAYQCQYTAGQALTVLSGPLSGFSAHFMDVIETAHDEYAKLRVAVEIFGRETTLQVSPDMVEGR